MFKYQKISKELYDASTLKEAKNISINVMDTLCSDFDDKNSNLYKFFEKNYLKTKINYYTVKVDNKTVYYAQCPVCKDITMDTVESFSDFEYNCDCPKSNRMFYNNSMDLIIGKNAIFSGSIFVEKDIEQKDLAQYMDNPEMYFKILNEAPLSISLGSYNNELIFYTKKHDGVRVYRDDKVYIYNKNRYSKPVYGVNPLCDPMDLSANILDNYNSKNTEKVDCISDMLSNIYRSSIKKSNKKRGEVKLPKEVKDMIMVKALISANQLYIDPEGEIHLLKIKDRFEEDPYIVKARYTKNRYNKIQLVQDKDDIKKIISNSKYKYSGLDIILDKLFENNIAEIGPAGVRDIIEYLDLYEENNKIETIIKHPLFKSFKLNMEDLNTLKIYDGKKPYQILGVSPAGFKTIELLSTYNLFNYHYSEFMMVKQIVSYDQMLIAKGKTISPDYMNLIAAMFNNQFGNTFPEMYMLLENYNIDERQVFEYIMKVYKSTYNKPLDIFGSWIDYLNMASLVGYNLGNPILLFPEEINVAHGQVLSLYNKIKTEVDEEKIKEILVNTSERYSYKGEEYSIIAPSSAADIVEEGNELRHCVKSYVEDVIRRSTNILFLRKNDNIDKPFYTVEIKGDQIVQIRGFSNKAATPAVSRFINEYKRVKNVL